MLVFVVIVDNEGYDDVVVVIIVYRWWNGREYP